MSSRLTTTSATSNAGSSFFERPDQRRVDVFCREHQMQIGFAADQVRAIVHDDATVGAIRGMSDVFSHRTVKYFSIQLELAGRFGFHHFGGQLLAIVRLREPDDEAHLKAGVFLKRRSRRNR